MKEQQNFIPHIVIYLLCLISSMFNYADFQLVSFASSLPMLDLITIFYFCIYRRLVSLWMVFLMGLVIDSMSGGVFGVTALTYIIILKVFHLFEIKKVSAEEFLYVVKRFVIFVAAILIFKSLILVIIDDFVINISYVLFQIVITSFVYILSHKIFEDFYKKYFFER